MKNKFLDKLKNDETYLKALSSARNDEERKKIMLVAESMFDALYGIFSKFNDLKNDPEKMKEVEQLFKSTNESSS